MHSIKLKWKKRIGSRNHFLCLPTLAKPAQPVYRLSRRNRTNEEEGPRRSGAEAEDKIRHLRGTIFLATQEALEVHIHGDTLSSLHRCKIHAKSSKDEMKETCAISFSPVFCKLHVAGFHLRKKKKLTNIAWLHKGREISFSRKL